MRIRRESIRERLIMRTKLVESWWPYLVRLWLSLRKVGVILPIRIIGFGV